MRMRQSLAQLEREFQHEAIHDRSRREQLRRHAVRRTRVRRRERIEKHQKLRFLMLLGSIALTVVVVTWAMFQTLAWLMG
jgi:cytochrome c-type biogenesis protein CcmH/NrfG